MRILLIDPPFYRFMGFRNYGFPVGLALLGAALEQTGHQVRIQDADFTGEAPRTNPEYLTAFYPAYLEAVRDESHPVWKEIEDEVARFAPDVVGVGIMTPKMPSAIRVIERVRRSNPRVTIVAGGPHPTLRAAELLEATAALDCVVRGDGFSGLPAVIRLAADGALPRDKVVEGDRAIPSFDALPFAGRHLLAHRSGYVSDELGTLVSSMGCPWHCSFCSAHVIWEKGRSARSAEKVVHEMRAVHADFGVRSFNFLDDAFTLPRERAIELSERLAAEDLPLAWTCGTHVNLLDAELVRAMRAGGCYKIAIGIESGSDRVLKAIRKGITKEKVREAKRILDQEGMLWTGFFLIGILDETREEILETLAFMKELKPPFASLGVYENYPGTALFEQGISLGITKPSMTRQEFFELPPNRYYFKDSERRLASVPPAQYERLVTQVLGAFHAHNHATSALIRRAWRKRGDYLKSPGHLLADLKRLWGKLKIAKSKTAEP